MILVITTREQEGAGRFGQNGSNSGIGSNKVLLKSQASREKSASPSGAPIKPSGLWKDSQVSDLQDEIKLISTYVLPPRGQLKGQQNLPMEIPKHGNIHGVLLQEWELFPLLKQLKPVYGCS